MAHHILRAACIAALTLGLAACGDDGSNEGSESSSSETASSTETKASGGTSEVEGSKLDDPAAGAKKQARRQAMKQKLEAIKKQREMQKKAVEAAKQAESKGGNTCAKAFHAAVAMTESMREQQGKKAPDSAPDKNAFVSQCQELPDEMQKCLVATYATQHGQECRKLQKNASPEVQQKLKGLMKNIR